MKTDKPSKILVTLGVFSFVGVAVALVIFAPLIAVILFVLLAAFTAGRQETRKSFITFVKDLIFGW